MRHALRLAVLTLALSGTGSCKQESESSSPPAASAGAEPAYYGRPTYGNPPGTGTEPGTTKAIAPGQGTFVRTTEPLTAYESEQGTTESDLRITREIRRAIAEEPNLTDAAKSVTVITHGEHVVLLGEVRTEREREIVEAIARARCSDVASHLALHEQ